MAGPPIDLDLTPSQLLHWLVDEVNRPKMGGLTIRASREWRVEDVTPVDGDGLDAEDGLAAHVAYGSLELADPGGGWRLALEVVDPIGGGTAPDWPPVDGEADGPAEVSLETFADTFGIDGLDGSVTLEAASPADRKRAERVVAHILADTHRG